MGVLGRPERVVYEARNFTTGLTNVVGYVVKPDLSLAGPYSFTEFAPAAFKGLYYFDLITTLSDPEGEWTIMIWSPTEQIRSPYKVRLDGPVIIPTNSSASSFQRADVVGMVEDRPSEIIGMVESGGDLTGIIEANPELVGAV